MKFQIILVFISLISEADEHFEVVLTFICSIEISLFKCLAPVFKIGSFVFSTLFFEFFLYYQKSSVRWVAGKDSLLSCGFALH